MRTGAAIGLLSVATVLVAAAGGFWLWGVFRYTVDYMHPAHAAALTGLIALLLAGGILWIADRLNR